MDIRFCSIFLIIISISLMAPLSSRGQASFTQDSPIAKIPRSHWCYRWGDSPVDDEGVPLWIYEDISGSEWQPMIDKKSLSSGRQGNFLWLVIQAPDGHWRDPALLLPTVAQNLEVYQNRQRVYQSAELKPSSSNKYWVARTHIVPLESLEAEAGSNMLFLRIYSDSRQIGIQEDKARLGSRADLIKLIIKLDATNFILGSMFCFAGLFAIFVYFRRRKQKPYAAFAFGIFVSCIGLSHISSSIISQLLIRNYALWYYLATTTFLLWPIGLYIFIEQILGRGYKGFIRRIWQAHILFAVCIILLDVTNVLPMTSAVFLLFGLLAIGIFIGVPSVMRTAPKASPEVKVLKIGILILMLSGLHDILVSFGVIPAWRMLYSWGVLAFALSLAYILEHRFAQAHRQLEEYSLTLEQKVEERTQELKEAQSQIVMQAKMASLGDLVAGVAHEMNNPIGVIHSAANTANRGISKIRNLLKSDHDQEQLQQSFELVETNNQIITKASDRVARIIQSLRMFASLDEALFQKVDIHQNIDTTLALLYHELRDKADVTKEYGEIPRIQCYPNELNQMLMNLLLNAIQAIEKRGTITIATYADQAQVYIKISDTGKGIHSENLPRVFDPGFTTQSAGVGKGLGLPIVYNIVQKHHGDIKIDSEVGKRTEVTVALPIKQLPQSDNESIELETQS